MMSGQTARHTVSSALDCAPMISILKPFDDEIVLTTVKRALGMEN